jgi:broad specificity phosphatase PhoE
MSDLQCAATLLLVAPGETGRALDLGRSLHDVRLAVIYTSDLPAAVETAATVGAGTGAPVTVLEGLADDADVRAELEGIADLHRGETVLVVSSEAASGAVVPQGTGPTDGVVELTIDADGWVLHRWAGATASGSGPDTWIEMRDSDEI